MATISTSRTPVPVYTILRGNFVTNPRMGVDLTGYTFGSGPSGVGALTRLTGPLWNDFSTAARITWTTSPSSAGNAGVIYRLDSIHTIGTAFVFSAYGRPTWAGATTCLLIQFYDSSGTLLRTDFGVASAHAQLVAERRSIVVSRPAGSTRADIRFAITAGTVPSAGDRLDVTGFMAELGPALGTYFDGATPPHDDISYIWSGVPHASISYERGITGYDTVTDTTPELVLGYESTRRSRNKVHEILGGGTVVSLGESGLRTGRLELFYLTEQDAVDAELMHSKPAVFTLATPETPTTAMTYTLADGGSIVRTLDAETRSRWVVAVDFQEVAA